MTELGASRLPHRVELRQGGESVAALPTDFHFTDRDFDWLRNLASAHSGIVLLETKRNMIYGRLSKRLRHLGLKKFSEYRSLLESGDGEEFTEFINALTTNLTSFFREPHHFDHIREVGLPQLLSTGRTKKTLRVWSAGCSTGEEPYTLSMVLNAALNELGGGWDYRILATDLDSRVLATGAAGVYPEERVSGLDHQILQRWFLRGAGAHRGKVRTKPELQAPISFQQLNLVKDWSMNEPLDMIFCRNVVIYFDKPTQTKIFKKFADSLNPGGFLYIGHSETLFHAADRFELVGKTTYRKIR